MARIRSSGFTLVELLVVIAIISILASMLLPVLGRARRAAQKIQCATNIKQISIGLSQYADDFEGWLPMMCTPGPGDWVPAWEKWHGCLSRLKYVAVPDDRSGVYACPNRHHSTGISYGLNHRMSAPCGNGQSGPFWWVVNAASDSGGYYNYYYTKKTTKTYLVGDCTGNDTDTTYNYSLSSGLAAWAMIRHEQAINMSFHDLHVKLIRRHELDTSWNGSPAWRNP